MARPTTPTRVPAKAAAPPVRVPPKTASRPAPVPPPRTATPPARTVPAEPRREEQQPPRALTRPVTNSGAMITQGFDEHLPAFMHEDMGRGTEDMSQEDLEIPRLKLMQGVSKELQENDQLRAGYFYHPAADLIFTEPFLAVPLLMDRRFILWRPRDQGGGILARADDGVHWSPPDTDFRVTLDKKDGGNEVIWRTAKTVKQSGLDAWGSMNPDDPKSPPAATLMYNYLLAFPEYPDVVPAVFTFQRSAIRNARKFNTKIRTIRAPIFGVVYQFGSVVDTNGRGQDFFNVQTTAYGRVTDESAYTGYKAIYEAYSSKGMNIRDLDSAQDEGIGDNANDSAESEGHPGY
jgi:predicted nucleic-acid-binding Zn-ribbon protein